MWLAARADRTIKGRDVVSWSRTISLIRWVVVTAVFSVVAGGGALDGVAATLDNGCDEPE